MNFATKINLLDLTPDTRQLLNKFLSRRHWDGRHITRGGIYWAGWQPIYFSHDFVIRKKSQNIWRYDVIDDKPCGKGQAGSAYKVLAVLRRMRGNYEEFVVTRKQKRIYKAQENAATAEFSLMKRCPHMKVRGLYRGMPTLFSMRMFEGVLLDEALNEDRRSKPFTHAERYRITISLLRALKRQIHDNMVLHRDIKPDNIFYNAETGEISIFDLDVSELIIGETDIRSRGNAMYTAPEDFISTVTRKPVTLNEYRYSLGRESHCTVKSDIYSIARVIGLVWRDNDPIFLDKNSDHHKMMIDRITHRWEPNFQLFHNISAEIPTKEAKLIEGQLRAMTAVNPRERPSLTECIDYFERLYLEYKIQNLPVEKQVLFRSAHQIALNTLEQLDDIEMMHDVQRRMFRVFGASLVSMHMTLATALEVLRNNDQEVLAAEIEDFCHPRKIIPEDVILGRFMKSLKRDSALSSIINVLNEEIDKLPDDTNAVVEFIETIEVRCLTGIKEKAQLKSAITNLVNEYVDSDITSKQFYNDMQDAGHTLICEELDQMNVNMQAQRLTLDNKILAARHINKKIQTMIAELTTAPAQKI